MSSNLGELLVRENILNKDQLKSAQDFKKKNDVSLGSAMVSLGYLSAEEMAQALSRELGYPFIDLDQFEVYPDVLDLISADVAKKYMVMPIHLIKNCLTLAMMDPSDLEAVDDIKFRTGLSLQPVIASEEGIMNAIQKYYGSSDALRVKQVIDDIEQAEDSTIHIVEEAEEEEFDVEEAAAVTDEAPIITLVNSVLIDAIKKGASDVHFEPYEKSFRIRYRLDGTLHEMMNLALRFRNAVLSRVKILANMNIAEKRLPQDGRMKMKVKLEDGEKKDVDMRVSCVPTMFGEKIVVRILDKEMLKLDLTHLGFEDESLLVFSKGIKKPWGIILVTGPTGSGKTNTLYSAISDLNSIEKNIMTAENPVEFYLAGINQVDIKEEIGLDFSRSLKSFLRQDPDVLLVGEMRDKETADIAIKAALTGHLVFSTIHTNDAASTVNRLMNMDVEPFLIADSLILIVAQRLVRRLCKNCHVKQDVPQEVLKDIGFAPEEAESVQVYKPYGCSACSNTGYKGRVGLFEVIEITNEIKDLILARAQSRQIKSKAMEQGMITLRRSGLMKIKQGITSIEEVLRETVRD
ncbi:MAG: type IV-A pilus assembly ATPase PilB [Candidatus Aminicenantes bacterium]|jgi:type IV pilus assembly protein PilB